MKKCTKCKKENTTKYSLCESCRTYYKKRYRLQKIRKNKLFFVKKNDEIKLLLIESEDEAKKLMETASAVVNFSMFTKKPGISNLFKFAISNIEFRINAGATEGMERNPVLKPVVEYIKENIIYLKKENKEIC